MARVQGLLLTAVLLLATSSSSSLLPVCPQSCTCLSSTLDCSYLALTSVPHHIHNNVTNLDLSHNRLQSVSIHRTHHDLQAVWLANNTITHLSLCIERDYHDRRRRTHRLGRGCVSWAPALQLLSAERNQLVQLPVGLNSSKSLQVLRLSFNKISILKPEEFRNLLQLKELHLQHNLITSLDPLMFQDLVQLEVLDVSFNLLNRIHPSTYLSLRNIATHVSLDGNRWACDCSMRTLRRWLARDQLRGLQPWRVVCGSPSTLSGTDLLQLEEDDLNCFTAEGEHQPHLDVTVHSGSQIVLSCSLKDSGLGTPADQASEKQSLLGLVISDITQKEGGVYECVSEVPDIPSHFNLHISKTERTKRKIRSVSGTDQPILGEDRAGEKNASATCDLALAVCLSIFITFLVAFIVGVITRPYIEVLCSRIGRKRPATETRSDSHMEQGQYDNEAFSEEPERTGNQRERRVTFSSIDGGDERNVDYYNIEEGDRRESYIEVLNKTGHDVGNPNKLAGQKSSDKSPSHSQEASARRSSSSSSNSSTSDSDERKSRAVKSTAKAPRLDEERVQQRAGPSQATDRTSQELLGEDEEQFEFSDSSGSSTTNSSRQLGSLKGPKRNMKRKSDKRVRNSGSSSSSHVSDDEVTHYTVNPDQDEMEERGNGFTNNAISVSASREHQIHAKKSRPVLRRQSSLSSHSSGSSQRGDSDVFTTPTKTPLTKWKSPSSAVVDSPRVVHSSSSSSDDKEDVTHNVKHRQTRPNERRREPTEIRAPSLESHSASSADSDDAISGLKSRPNQNNSQVKSQVSPTLSHNAEASSESSSSDSEDQGAGIRPQTHGYGGLLPPSHIKLRPIKRRFAVKVKHTDAEILDQTEQKNVYLDTTSRTFDSTSSSDSGDETSQTSETNKAIFPVQSGVYQNASTQWPRLNFQNLSRLKRRLAFKVMLPAYSSSSSSDSEEEKAVVGVPLQHYDFVEGLPQTQQHIHIKPIKRRFAVKTRKRQTSTSDSSTSSDSEGEANQRQDKYMVKSGLRTSQTVSYDRWPSLNLLNVPQLKRRLQFKVPRRVSDSSSSSESEEEVVGIGHQVHEYEAVQATVQNEQQDQWIVINRKDIRLQTPSRDSLSRINRPFETPSPASHSSSSSDSEDDTIVFKSEQHREKYSVQTELKTSQAVSYDKWPSLNLLNVPQLKRSLQFKVTQFASDSSSSSDSEEEIDGIGQQVHEYETVQEMVQDPWTVMTQKQTHPQTIQRDSKPPPYMDRAFETPSPASHSSTSSDSEDDTIALKTKQHREQYSIQSEFKASQTGNHDKWPSLNLLNVPLLRRRLQFKATMQVSDSSSSSESEEEMFGIQHQVHEYETVRETAQIQKQDPWTVITQKETHLQTPVRVSKPLPNVYRPFETPSPASHSSTSSDSEDEHQDKYIVHSEFKTSQTVNYGKWPSLNLLNVPQLKRRLQFKVTLQVSESSSSSESEEEMFGTQQKHGQKHDRWITREDTPLQTPSQDSKSLPYVNRPSPDTDSSLSSDSEDEARRPRSRVDQEAYIVKSEAKMSPAMSQRQWPGLEILHVPQLKRRLEFKVTVPDGYSSSSSDSEGEPTGTQIHEYEYVKETVHIQEHIKRDVDTQKDSFPRIPYPKRRLDFKAPTPADTSSSSESEDEMKSQQITERQFEYSSNTTSQLSPIIPEARRRTPSPGLQFIPRVKRRINFEVQLPSSDSSSSSDSDSEPANVSYIDVVEEKLSRLKTREKNLSRNLVTKSPPEKTQPEILKEELKYPVRIKRRLDIKATPVESSSSSSSDSDDEVKPARMVVTHTQRSSVSQSHDLKTQWPKMDVGYIPRIKRRLDFKTQSCSSSSSDSESETESDDSAKRWPIIDLNNTRRLRRRMDIKGIAPIPKLPAMISEEQIPTQNEATWMMHSERVRPASSTSESLSSSDSEAETAVRHQKTEEVVTRHHATRYEEPFKPVLKFSMKRRLDIKAPTPVSDSSSSSDSEVEPTVQAKITTHWTQFPVESPQKARPRLEKYVKRLSSDSSSSSDSDDETVIKDPEKWWPIVDLQRRKRLRRRLDIKPLLLLSKESRGDVPETLITETLNEEAREVTLKTIHQEPQVGGYEEPFKPYVKFSVKRRLDIKAPAPVSDTSSSSDSEVEPSDHSMIMVQEATYRPKFPVETSRNITPQFDTQATRLDLKQIPREHHSDSSSSSDSDDETTIRDTDKWWPIVDLQRRKRLRRHLDFKPLPLPSRSPEGAVIIEKQVVAMHSKEPEMGTLTGVHPDFQVDVQSFRPYPKLSIKRRLDIKAPTPDSDSSSSSDSEVEPTIQAQTTVQEPMYRLKSPQNARPQLIKHVTRLDLEHSSDSSSSSDSDNERRIKDPEKWWPIVDLQHRKRLRRRLDIKSSPQFPTSPEGTVIIEKRTIEMQRKEPVMGTLKGFSQETQPDGYQEPFRPYLKFSMKRRLDIKAPAPVLHSSSSSDSEVEPTVQARKTVQEATSQLKFPMDVPKTARPQLEKQGTRLDSKQIPQKHHAVSSSSSDSDDDDKGKAVDIKASKPLFQATPVSNRINSSQVFYEVQQTDGTLRPKPSRRDTSVTSSSSDGETETTARHPNTVPKTIYRVYSWSKTSPNLSRDADSKQVSEKWWPIVDLERIKRLKRRLDIKPSRPFTKLPVGSEWSADTLMLQQRQKPVVNTLRSQIPEPHTNGQPEIPKATPPKSDSSSSDSDSEAEAKIPSRTVQVATYRPQSEARALHQTINDGKPHSQSIRNTGGSITNSSEMKDLELKSRWETMDLGSSRSRNRHGSASRSIDIPPLLSPLSDSPYTSGSESTMRGNSRPQFRTTGIVKDTSLNSTNAHANKFATVALEANAVNSAKVRDYTTLTSEQKRKQYSQPSTLQTQHQRHMSSSSSESEDDVEDDKATRTSSIPGDSGRYSRPKILEDAKHSQSFNIVNRTNFTAQKTDPVTSFESSAWKKDSVDEEFATEQRWRPRQVELRSSSTLTEPANFSSYSPKSFSHGSDDDLMAGQVKRSSTPVDEYSSIYNSSVPSTDVPFDMFYMPRTSRRGLGALRAMSEERRIWEANSGNLLVDFPAGSDQPTGSYSIDERGGANSLDYKPPYGNGTVFDDDMPSGLPPPIPTMPLTVSSKIPGQGYPRNMN